MTPIVPNILGIIMGQGVPIQSSWSNISTLAIMFIFWGIIIVPISMLNIITLNGNFIFANANAATAETYKPTIIPGR